MRAARTSLAPDRCTRGTTAPRGPTARVTLVTIATQVVITLALTALVYVSGGVPRAAAGYGAPGAGSASADAQSIPVPAAPTAVVTGANVVVSWTAVTLSGGTPVSGYSLERLDATGTPTAILAGCAGTITGVTCTENGVPAGTWSYRVRALIGSWVGPVSAPSATITVAATTLTITSTQPITALPATVTGVLGNFVVGETVTYRLDSPTGTVLTGTPTTVGSTSQAVSVQIPLSAGDAPHSIHVIGSSGNVAAASVSIVIPPVLQSVAMYDTDSNGKVDRVLAVFDDVLAPYTAGVAPWTLTNIPSGGVLSAVSVTGNTATLTITEGSGAATTAVGSFTVALAANSAGIRDVYGHTTSFAAQAPLDRAAPAPVTMVMQDSNTNGKVDRVSITWSETLAATATSTAPWTLANVPSAGVLSAASSSTTTGTLTITEGAGAIDTGVGSFTISLAATATGPRDAAGNQSAFPARAPSDGARPMPVSFTDTDGATNGRIEAGDTLSVLFSEPIDTTSITSTVTVTLTDPSGAGADRLTITGLTNGARTTGGNGYVSLNNVNYGFANSPVAFANGNRTIVVTVGPTCAGTCGALGTQGTNATFSFQAATGLRDVVGNLVTTTTRSASIRLF
ncbi:MAG: hypothetical protein U0Q03_23970 [Acidimicrobiales bacterium]